ncbi:penicillin-binding protein 2 [Paraflavisolibacter sp. H34]|uniref:penicillin-binding protein 2 n=1 Tax=Huijunlia imazamoxiresistens TaxID=3127457 RepID=UPI003018732B
MSVFNQSRSYIIRIIFLVTFTVIIAQLVNLQVFSSKYQKLAEENAVFRKTIYPPRGIVYDRNNRAIVNNTLMYDLVVTPSEVRGVDTAYLCQLLEIDTTEFRQRLVTAIIKNGRYRPSSFESLLSPEKYARIEENMWRFAGKGFYLQERPVRTYPFNVGAHFMGYINEVDSGIIARSGGFYRPGDYAGRSGIESFYEKALMGQRGVQYLIKDHKNRLVGHFENGEFDSAAIAGRGLRTFIDVDVQQLLEKLMQNKVGAAVAIEPKTGGVIAMVSAPNFSPSALTGSNFKKTYGKFVLDVSRPLLNRAIKGQYPPGSTFKPLGGLVALDEGLITPSFGYPCGGRYYACGIGKPACTHSGGGHAADLRRAIANSCNSYFTHVYRMAVDNPRIGNVRKGYSKWKDYMNAFGLGTRIGIDLPGEDKGNIPDTSKYNKVYRNSWSSCTNLTLGIGQDMMTATPLQLANAMCIIANKGYYYTPHIVKSIDNEGPSDTALLNPFRRKHEVLTHISDEAFEAIIWGMQDVVTAGTARGAAIPGINICAKTGTAQNFRYIGGKKIELNENSMFVCFAPRENPKIAIAVVVENAGFGSTAAAPIASLMMEQYLTDSLRPESKKKAEELSKKNFMPSILAREQYIADSTRAVEWFKITKDSSFLRKFYQRSAPKKDSSTTKPKPANSQPKPEKRVAARTEALEPKNQISLKKKTATT